MSGRLLLLLGSSMRKNEGEYISISHFSLSFPVNRLCICSSSSFSFVRCLFDCLHLLLDFSFGYLCFGYLCRLYYLYYLYYLYLFQVLFSILLLFSLHATFFHSLTAVTHRSGCSVSMLSFIHKFHDSFCTIVLLFLKSCHFLPSLLSDSLVFTFFGPLFCCIFSLSLSLSLFIFVCCCVC